MRTSNLGEALTQAGFDQFEHQARTVAANFIKAGGSREKWLACFDAAEQMSGGGRATIASDGQSANASARQPLEGGEARRALPQGQVLAAFPPSFNRGVNGQKADAHKRHIPVAIPVREPAKPSRGLASILSIQPHIRRGFLMIHKTSDGRPWGEVGWHELDGMKRDGAIAKAIKARIAAPADQFTKLDNLLSDAQFMELYNVAQKQIS